MGRYVNKVGEINLPIIGKAKKLIELGAKEIEAPTQFAENLVYVHNPAGFVDAAMYVYNQSEFDFIKSTSTGGVWLQMENVEHFAY
jgi:hypothetical protein